MTRTIAIILVFSSLIGCVWVEPYPMVEYVPVDAASVPAELMSSFREHYPQAKSVGICRVRFKGEWQDYFIRFENMNGDQQEVFLDTSGKVYDVIEGRGVLKTLPEPGE